jgi:hypothetical protein
MNTSVIRDSVFVIRDSGRLLLPVLSVVIGSHRFSAVRGGLNA